MILRRYYFDTSAINKILEDDRVHDEEIRLFARYYPAPSSYLNLVELASSSDANRRVELLKTAKLLSGGYKPLAAPNDLLKSSIVAVDNRENQFDITVDEEHLGFDLLLQNPEEGYDDRVHNELNTYREEQEEWFNAMHSGGRSMMQAVVQSQGDRFGSPFEFAEYCLQNEELMDDHLSNIRFVPPSMHGRSLEIMEKLEPWRFFFGSMYYLVYQRGIAGEYYGRNRNPGSIDTQQAIYLSSSIGFVTDDVRSGQLSALQDLSKLGHIDRQVMSYGHFRDNVFLPFINRRS